MRVAFVYLRVGNPELFQYYQFKKGGESLN